MNTFGANIDVEDTVVANLEFKSGSLGLIEITTAARPDDYESSISILGDKGLAIVGGWATNDLITYSPDHKQEKLNSEVFPDVYGFGHTEIYVGAHEVIMNNGEPAVAYDDAMSTIQLLHAIYRSAEIGDWIMVADELESERLGQPNEGISNLYRTIKTKKV